MPWSVGTRSAVRLALVGGATAAGVCLLRWTSVRVPCPVHEVTGLYCPGCGVTRGAEALAEGDPMLALRQYPLLPIVAIIGLWWAAVWAAAPVAHPRVSEPLARRLLLVTIVVAAAFGVVRNLPQFEVLRPL